jgi:hypothetical protein
LGKEVASCDHRLLFLTGWNGKGFSSTEPYDPIRTLTPAGLDPSQARACESRVEYFYSVFTVIRANVPFCSAPISEESHAETGVQSPSRRSNFFLIVAHCSIGVPVGFKLTFYSVGAASSAYTT